MKIKRDIIGTKFGSVFGTFEIVLSDAELFEAYKEYSYTELRDAAIDYQTPENVAALAKWMEQYGSQFWNGECYDIDEGRELWPIYGEMDEDENYPIIGYEIR